MQVLPIYVWKVLVMAFPLGGAPQTMNSQPLLWEHVLSGVGKQPLEA